tara:strand:- start:2873 stop:4414 length:1542 start_codon:yes stop_codon:yes gene_type:complete
MLHPSTKRLIDKLSEMTRKQRVAWSEGENGTITHDTEGYRVVLTPEPHAVLLTDALGKEIESCTPAEFIDETDASGRPYSAFVADLYREAHRHARGAEKAIHTVLKGLEIVEAEPEAETDIAMDPAELIEDPGDDTDSLPEAYPEVEGQNDMARAVASMADEVNGGAGEPEDEPELVALSDAATAYENNAAEEIEPEVEADADVEAEIVAAERDAPDLESNEADEISSQIASLLPEYQQADADTDTVTEAEADEDTLWPEDENAPDVQSASEPEPAQPAPQAASAFGGGFFGSGMGDLSRYKTAPVAETPVETGVAPEPESEPAPALAATEPDPEPYIPAFTDFDAPAEPDDPAPEITSEADVAPEAPRSFSLSGLSSGFGLGSAGRASSPVPELAPDSVENVPSPERDRVVIDGTVDLPDDIPLSEFDAGPDTPAYPDPLTDAAEQPFHFSEPEPATETVTEEAAPEQAPARPEEKAFEVPAQTVEPQQADEPASESPPPAPKVTTRFNPWN